MLHKRYSKIVVCLLIVLLCSISAGILSAAPVSVSALVADYITFLFDNRSQLLPEGYTVLMHENRTYVPARFVAEQLGASVVWDGNTRTIRITSQACPDCTGLEEQVSALEREKEELKQEIVDLEAKIETLEEEKETKQPDLNYRSLPQSRSLRDMEVEVFLIVEDQSHARIYVSIENKQLVPLQLLQRNTIAVIDGEEYKTADASYHLLDGRWYHNIDYEDTKEGYIIIPSFPEDKDKMLLTLTILYNDSDQETIDLEFAIRY